MCRCKTMPTSLSSPHRSLPPPLLPRRRRRAAVPLLPISAAAALIFTGGGLSHRRLRLDPLPVASAESLPPRSDLDRSSLPASSTFSSSTTSSDHRRRSSRPTTSSSRAYPLGCSTYPPSYYDYETFPFPPVHRPEWMRKSDDFLLLRRLGAGKFSDVFEATDERWDTARSSDDGSCAGGGWDGERMGEGTVDPRSLVVIKCLKPVSEKKVRRELLVLSHVSELPNMARLRGVVVPEYDDGEKEAEKGRCSRRSSSSSSSSMPSLVLEHAGPDSRWLCHGPGVDAGRQMAEEEASSSAVSAMEEYYLSEYEIKYYLFHLLIALDALHARGIMHRDVKPRNVLINRSFTRESCGDFGRDLGLRLRPLVLIDLGLADFYRPSATYNVRVASRHYKSPELLVGIERYDYAIDLWGVGCILAGLLLRREPFFRGRDNPDQLGKIAAVLGRDRLLEYCRRYGVELSGEMRVAVNRSARSSSRGGQGSSDLAFPSGGSGGSGGGRRSWLSLLPRDAPVPSREGLDLLDRLLVYDHGDRLTAREAMDHTFFDDVRDRARDEVRCWEREEMEAEVETKITEEEATSEMKTEGSGARRT